jgi:beta-glucanase (GH16 family)
MKAADCSGVISSFFTYTNNPTWDEIDIEFLGKDMTQVQFNYFTDGEGGHEYLYNLGYDASKEFHEYGFEWLPDSITWFIDGVKIYKATENIPTHPQNLMMNLWNCIGKEGWSGDFEVDRNTKLPVSSHYQYLVYIPAE